MPSDTLRAVRGPLSPLVLLALGAGALGALSRAVGGAAPPQDGYRADIDAPRNAGAPRNAEEGLSDSPIRYEVPCPPGQLPDGGICVPVPDPTELLHPAGSTAVEALPLRADRPPELARYLLPTEALPDAGATHLESSSEFGPALRLPAREGTPVRTLRLEGQAGATEVAFATSGPSALVVTVHRVERERGVLTYLLLHGELGSIEPAHLDATPGQPVPLDDGALLGQAGPQGVLLGLRQLRRDVKLSEAVPDLAPDAVFPVDPRNLLPLAP